MAAIIRWGRQLIQRPPSPPKQLRSSHFHSISSSQLIEEENLPYYKPEQFYPVRIGEVLNSDYQVLGKLEYGAYSTVWFCRDLSHHRYVAVKVYTQTHSQSSKDNREVEVYEHLSKLNSLHPGQAYIRGVYDKFKLDGPDGCHICLVHPPLHMTVSAVQRQGLRQRYNELILRETCFASFAPLIFYIVWLTWCTLTSKQAILCSPSAMNPCSQTSRMLSKTTRCPGKSSTPTAQYTALANFASRRMPCGVNPCCAILARPA